MTDSFAFEYTIHVQKYGSLARGVRFTRTDEGVKVTAADAELESVDMIAPESYAAFNALLGAPNDADNIDTAKVAVEAGKPNEVEHAVRETGTRVFSWADWDSDFYGVGQSGAADDSTKPEPYSY